MSHDQNLPVAVDHPSSSMTLGRKLAIGFAALTTLTVLLGGLALDRMGAMNHSMSDIRDNFLPSAVGSAQIAIAVGEVRRWQGSLLLSDGTNAAEVQLAMSKLAAAEEAVDKARATYAPMIDPGEEQHGYDTVFDPSWKAFRAQSEQLMAAADPRRHEDALATYRTTSRKAYQTLQDFLMWDIGYNRKGGQAAGEVSRQVYAPRGGC